METININLVRDGNYTGITDGTKIVMIRDPDGKVTPGFEHLMPIFDSKTQSAALSIDDFLMIKKALEDSLVFTVTTESVDVPADGVRDGDSH